MLIQPRIDLSIIQLLAPFANTLEEQWLRVQRRIHPKDVEDDPGCRSIITRTDDIAVANDKDELALVVIVENRERVDRPLEGFLAFGITGNLANDELVEYLGVAFMTELKRSQD
jgi:hypothetical protein